MSDKPEASSSGESKVIKFSEAGTRSLNLVANPSTGQNPMQAATTPAPEAPAAPASGADAGGSTEA